MDYTVNGLLIERTPVAGKDELERLKAYKGNLARVTDATKKGGEKKDANN